MANLKDSPPVTWIRPSRRWAFINFRELFQYRDLFACLIWRNIKIRYKQTALGFLWVILAPLLQMLIFTLLFNKVAKMPSDGLHPSIYYFSGLVIWRLFQTSFMGVSQCLLINADIFTKIYFPRLIAPLSVCLTNLVDFSIAFCAVLLLMFCHYGLSMPLSALLLPGLLLMALATALGFGLILASIGVKYRDVRVVIAYIAQIWMFLTVIVPFSNFEQKAETMGYGAYKYLYGLNPMAGVVEGFRWCLLHSHMTIEKVVNGETISAPAMAPMPWQLMSIGLAVTVCVLTASLVLFRRVERTFVDIL